MYITKKYFSLLIFFEKSVRKIKSTVLSSKKFVKILSWLGLIKNFKAFSYFIRNKSCIYKYTVIFTFTFYIGLITQDAIATINNSNLAAAVVCDVIMIIRGRIGRVIISIVILLETKTFIEGKVSWHKIIIIIISTAGMYSDTMAYFILPSRIKGIRGERPSGGYYDPNAFYSPQELVRDACPALVA